MQSELILLVFVGILAKFMYHQHNLEESMYESHNHYVLVAQYYIGTTTMHKRKPILWIHTQTELNSRNWLTFGSRNTHQLNQPYLQITMKSIYDHCKDTFNICLINDDSFNHLLNWNVEIDDIPCKSTYRTLALSMILHEYGGLLVPQSFLCYKDLTPLLTPSFLVAEGWTQSTRNVEFEANPTFMSCKRNCTTMKAFIQFQEKIYKEKTEDHVFSGRISKWLSKHATILDGVKIGIKCTDGTPVTIQDLLGNVHIPISQQKYGILLPHEDLLTRTKYNWFSRLSTDQVLSSNMIISKYMIAAH
jgi:hypothetical protein